jgi:Protease II
MKWWKERKLLYKKNTFEDYIAVGKFLIEKKYTSEKQIIRHGWFCRGDGLWAL